MDKMNLYKCVQALSVKWKSFLGLGTEYVGYFKWEMAWALMGYYRYALPGEWADSASPTVILKSICDSIESINTDLDCAHKLTIDDVYKEVLEQAENFKKYSE